MKGHTEYVGRLVELLPYKWDLVKDGFAARAPNENVRRNIVASLGQATEEGWTGGLCFDLRNHFLKEGRLDTGTVRGLLETHINEQVIPDQSLRQEYREALMAEFNTLAQKAAQSRQSEWQRQ